VGINYAIWCCGNFVTHIKNFEKSLGSQLTKRVFTGLLLVFVGNYGHVFVINMFLYISLFINIVENF